MKKFVITGCCLVLCGIATAWGQQTDFQRDTTNEVVRYTLVERFEPELALTAGEREEMRAERFNQIDSRLRMLDTMDISERKRNRLIEALVDDPFHPKLEQVFADIELEEEH